MRKLCFLMVLFATALAGFKAVHRTAPYPFPRLAYFPDMPVADNNPVTIAGADLGRHLFYDTILSAGMDLSCASCHKQSAAFSDAPHNFSKGNNDAQMDRNTLPLFNLAWYPSLFWDGKAVSIEEQVFHPVRAHKEMNLQWQLAEQRIRKSKFYRQKFKAAFGDERIDSVLIARAIAQFERTLLSYRSKFDEVVAGRAYLTKEEYEGFELVNDMTRGSCLHCHTTDAHGLGTEPGFSNNGLDAITDAATYKDKGRGAITGNATDNGKFKIPSLRNLSYTAPYMHDGRYKTIDDVLDFYSDSLHYSANIDNKMEFAYMGGPHLTAEEKRKIKAFLLTLDDAAFVKDTAFGDPFRL